MKNYMHFIFGSLLCLIFAGNLNAQRVDGDVFEDRTLLDGFVVGSYFSLMYANGWRVEASPGIGYRFLNDRVVAGLGFQWTYNTQVYRTNVDFGTLGIFPPGREKFEAIGPRAFIKVHPFWQVYAIAEYQYLGYTYDYKTRDDVTILSADGTDQPLFFGAGYTSGEFARGFTFNAEILIDVLYDSFSSVRSAPLTYRVGFFYGF